MRKWNFVAAAAFALLGPHAQARAGSQPAMDELQRLLAPINSLQASFTQTELNQDGALPGDLRQQGRMQVSKPGRMRWVVDGEFGQQLVTDGETLWLYDPDLAQVSIQPVTDNSPALLLMGDFQQLSANYRIAYGSAANSYQLEPKQPDDAYRQITVVFENQLPKSIAVLNGLGEQTLIEFRQVQLNPELDPAQFTFQAPAGVEEIYNQ